MIKFILNLFKDKRTYKQLLQDKKWKKKRKRIIAKLAPCNCSVCDESIFKRRFDVHHKYYKKNKKPWEYPIKAFLLLHSDCHKRLHKR